MSWIIRRRSGLTVLVSLMESSFLIEADEHLDSQDGSSPSLPLSSHLATDLSALAPAQRAGAQRLRALAQSGGAGMSALAPLLEAKRTYARSVSLLSFVSTLQDQLRSERVTPTLSQSWNESARNSEGAGVSHQTVMRDLTRPAAGPGLVSALLWWTPKQATMSLGFC